MDQYISEVRRRRRIALGAEYTSIIEEKTKSILSGVDSMSYSIMLGTALLFLSAVTEGLTMKLFQGNWGKKTLSGSQKILDAIDGESSDIVIQGLLDELSSSSSSSTSSVKSLKKLSGCFEVQRTLGEPSWTKYSKILSGRDSKNYQIFTSRADNKFINLSEYGFGCFATASGTYCKSSPGTFDASVNKVSIHIGSFVVNLAVQGTGEITVLVSDNTLRAITSEEKATAIQRPVSVPEKYKALLDNEGISV